MTVDTTSLPPLPDKKRPVHQRAPYQTKPGTDKTAPEATALEAQDVQFEAFLNKDANNLNPLQQNPQNQISGNNAKAVQNPLLNKTNTLTQKSSPIASAQLKISDLPPAPVQTQNLGKLNPVNPNIGPNIGTSALVSNPEEAQSQLSIPKSEDAQTASDLIQPAIPPVLSVPPALVPQNAQPQSETSDSELKNSELKNSGLQQGGTDAVKKLSDGVLSNAQNKTTAPSGEQMPSDQNFGLFGLLGEAGQAGTAGLAGGTGFPPAFGLGAMTPKTPMGQAGTDSSVAATYAPSAISAAKPEAITGLKAISKVQASFSPSAAEGVSGTTSSYALPARSDQSGAGFDLENGADDQALNAQSFAADAQTGLTAATSDNLPFPALDQTIDLVTNTQASPTLTTQTQVGASANTVKDLASQIWSQVQNKTTRFSLTLNPEGLGRVDVAVVIGAQGKLSASLTFDQTSSAKAVSDQSQTLQKALKDAGFQIDQNDLQFQTSTDSPGGFDLTNKQFSENFESHQYSEKYSLEKSKIEFGDHFLNLDQSLNSNHILNSQNPYFQKGLNILV